MPISPGYKKMKNYLKESGKFKLISRWTNANTVECDDGKTVQSKIGGIDGISSSLTANSTTQAASTNLTHQLRQNIDNIRQSFQDGCDTIVAGCTSYGSTPSSNSPQDIVKSIGTIYNNRYSQGYSTGYSEGQSMGYNQGYAQGQVDFKPVILSGTITMTHNGRNGFNGGIGIPSGLDYVCAAITSISECGVYNSSNEGKLFTTGPRVSATYDRNSGWVAFSVWIDGGDNVFTNRDGSINYQIMYIPK